MNNVSIVQSLDRPQQRIRIFSHELLAQATALLAQSLQCAIKTTEFKEYINRAAVELGTVDFHQILLRHIIEMRKESARVRS